MPWYVALARSSQWENASTGVEGAIVAELESLKWHRRLECGLISQINDANSATCNTCSTVISCWNICRHAALNIRSALVAFRIFNAVHWYYWMPWAVLFIIAFLPLKHFLFTYIASNWTVSVKDFIHEAQSPLSWRGWTTTQCLNVMVIVQQQIIKFGLLTLEICIGLLFFHMENPQESIRQSMKNLIDKRNR